MLGVFCVVTLGAGEILVGMITQGAPWGDDKRAGLCGGSLGLWAAAHVQYYGQSAQDSSCPQAQGRWEQEHLFLGLEQQVNAIMTRM